MKNPEIVPLSRGTTAKFLLLIKRTAYRVRIVTSSALYLAPPGAWDMSLQGEEIVIAVPEARILDPQNRAFVTALLAVQPVRLALPFEHPVSVSALGAESRYYVRLPRACSFILEPDRG